MNQKQNNSSYKIMGSLEDVYLLLVFHLTFSIEAFGKIKWVMSYYYTVCYKYSEKRKTGAWELSFCFRNILKLSHLNKLHPTWF